ncbi:DNA repair protein rad13 [Smittium mucronatum]|uniref:DNA repair protein rad13 n=1 Tax=Smittium mucronatum TaxID=133383 RepID=A0A1R0H284_9FUNG|nr:DNA repair protein rad13 [Smittium mucronatum]
MRDSSGFEIENGHISGFFKRICKILHYGILPIFVFDGAPPNIKRKTMEFRKFRQNDHERRIKLAASKLLSAKLKAQVLGDVISNASSTPRQELKISSETKSPANKKITPTSGNKRSRDDYELPEVQYKQVNGSFVGEIKKNSPDIRLPTLDEIESSNTWGKMISDRKTISGYEIGNFDFEGTQNVSPGTSNSANPGNKLSHSEIDELLKNIDIDGEQFLELPIELQYAVLKELKDHSRQTSFKRLKSMVENSKTAMDFSQMQIENLVKRNKFMQGFMGVSGAQHRIMSTKTGESFKINSVASQRDVKYVLIRSDGPGGGWKLGAPNSASDQKNSVEEASKTSNSYKSIDSSEIIPNDKNLILNLPLELIDSSKEIVGENSLLNPININDSIEDSKTVLISSSDSDDFEDVEIPVDAEKADDNFGDSQNSQNDIFDSPSKSSSIKMDFKLSDSRDKFTSFSGHIKSAKKFGNEKLLSLSFDTSDSDLNDSDDGPYNQDEFYLDPIFEDDNSDKKSTSSNKCINSTMITSNEPYRLNLLKKLAPEAEKKPTTVDCSMTSASFDERDPVVDLNIQESKSKNSYFNGNSKSDAGAPYEINQISYKREDDLSNLCLSTDIEILNKPLNSNNPILIEFNDSPEPIYDALFASSKEHIHLQKSKSFSGDDEKPTANSQLFDMDTTTSKPICHSESFKLNSDYLKEDSKIIVDIDRLDSSISIPVKGIPKSFPDSDNYSDEEKKKLDIVTTVSILRPKSLISEGLSKKNLRTEFKPIIIDPEKVSHYDDPNYSSVKNEDNISHNLMDESPDSDVKISKKKKHQFVSPSNSISIQKSSETVDIDSNETLATPSPSIKTVEISKKTDTPLKSIGSTPNSTSNDSYTPSKKYVFSPFSPSSVDSLLSENSIEKKDFLFASRSLEKLDSESPSKSLLKNLSKIHKDSIEQIRDSNKTLYQARRDAAVSITDTILDDIRTLLGIFKIPYITAPEEAESSCALLEIKGHVDGVITDDSDVLLFGSKNVYRNFFNLEKLVMKYEYNGYSRARLIFYSYFLGSDYTVGVNGIGPTSVAVIYSFFGNFSNISRVSDANVTNLGNMEIPSDLLELDLDHELGLELLDGASTTEHCSRKARLMMLLLKHFYKFAIMSRESTLIVKKGAPKFLIKLANLAGKIEFPPDFPDINVAKAYLSPRVYEIDNIKNINPRKKNKIEKNPQDEPINVQTSSGMNFEWGVPDLDLIQTYMSEKVALSEEKVDQMVLPIIKKIIERKQGSSSDRGNPNSKRQTLLTNSFFGIKNNKPPKPSFSKNGNPSEKNDSKSKLKNVNSNINGTPSWFL